jgi:hypothetical protein
MSHNTAQLAWLLEKKTQHSSCLFLSGKGAALAGYVVSIVVNFALLPTCFNRTLSG